MSLTKVDGTSCEEAATASNICSATGAWVSFNTLHSDAMSTNMEALFLIRESTDHSQLIRGSLP